MVKSPCNHSLPHAIQMICTSFLFKCKLSWYAIMIQVMKITKSCVSSWNNLNKSKHATLHYFGSQLLYSWNTGLHLLLYASFKPEGILSNKTRFIIPNMRQTIVLIFPNMRQPIFIIFSNVWQLRYLIFPKTKQLTFQNYSDLNFLNKKKLMFAGP